MLEKFRQKLDTYLTLQQFPDSSLYKIKIAFRNVFIFINETLFESKESKKNRKKILCMKNKYSGTVLLLGSGPSLNNIGLDQIRYFQMQGGYVAATNTFLLSPKYREIEIDFYFMIDPDFWNTKFNRVIKIINSLINGGYFKGYLIQPANKNGLIPNYEKISYIDTRMPMTQKRKNFKPTKRSSFGYSVALSAIYTLKYYGFSRILFAGLDSNMYKYYRVMPNNELNFTRESFYADKFFNLDKLTDSYNEKIVKNLELPYCRDMRDILYANAFFLNDLRKISENCINVGHDESNDVAPRASLFYLVNSVPQSNVQSQMS